MKLCGMLVVAGLVGCRDAKRQAVLALERRGVAPTPAALVEALRQNSASLIGFPGVAGVKAGLPGPDGNPPLLRAAAAGHDAERRANRRAAHGRHKGGMTMEAAPSNNEASSGTSALDDGLAVFPVPAFLRQPEPVRLDYVARFPGMPGYGAWCADDPKYKKLITALAKANNIPLIAIENRNDIGEWLGHCKYDKEGKARKVKGTSSIAIIDYGEETEALSFVINYIKEKNL